jgi:hypothetical protein
MILCKIIYGSKEDMNNSTSFLQWFQHPNCQHMQTNYVNEKLNLKLEKLDLNLKDRIVILRIKPKT